MKAVRIIARILLGMVFIFSGFVKGIDGHGFAIKLSEYFVAFGLPEWYTLALVLGILVSVGELIIGVCLVIGLRMKVTAWAAFLFMAFFTVLTFYSALFSPVTDCGCFGDAIKLSNWGTFYKNVVLIAFAIFVFWQRKHYVSMFRPITEWIIVSAYSIAVLSVFLYCLAHLPIIDFRPYHVGADIRAGMEIPEGAPADEYKTSFLYKKDGVVKEFTTDNYPWNDSTWVWVETKQTLIKKGYEPPIHDFSITTEAGADITDSIVASSGYTFLLVSTELENANKEGMMAASKLYDKASEQGYGFYCLTASPKDFAASYKKANNFQFPYATTDKTTLKTIMRSNLGLILIKEGIVIGQWHYNDFPMPDYLKGNLLAKQINNQRVSDNIKMDFLFITVFLLSIAGLALLKRICKKE